MRAAPVTASLVFGGAVLTAADGGPVATKVTAADGTYSFSSLGAGTYFVQEVVPTGYVRTGPALASYYTVTLAANGTATSGSATGNNFDNAEVCDANTVTCLSFFITHCDGTTETVGRAHAHITFDETAGTYLLFDDGSHNGTFVVRRGTTIHVAARDPRGLRLDDCDELHFGRASVGVRTLPTTT